MDLFKINLFRGSVFKQIKFLASTPVNSQAAYYISEAGTVSKEIIPMHTGFMCPPIIKKAWMVIHTLKFKVHKKGVPLPDPTIFAISDRSYIPLDPNATMKPTDRERLTSLKDIASMRHAEARSEAGSPGQSDQTDTATLVLYIDAILIGLFIITFFILRALGD